MINSSSQGPGNPQKPASGDLTEKRHVLLGVTGSIAAYKAAELARLMVSWGYEVRVVMTDSAKEFITETTLSAVTGHPVYSEFWEEGAGPFGHIELADWADVYVIAPATADCIAKLAGGFADTPLLALALSTRAPILLAPAMNVNMYEHSKTQENVATLKGRGVHFVEPEVGALACGWNGSGRLADPAEIFYHVRRLLSYGDFFGKNVLITTGPTREYIDPVRFLTNRSSGKMGVALAREAFRRGATVTMVHGPMRPRVPGPVRCIQVISAQEMHDVVMQIVKGERAENDIEQGPGIPQPDIVIMSAAVADYRPVRESEHKIKKSKTPLKLDLELNPDILSEVGAWKRSQNSDEPNLRPTLVGFAVETGEIDDLLKEARDKLTKKNADMIVGNFAQDALELDTNRVWMVDRTGRQEEVATSYKSRVANRILDSILRL